MSELQQAIHRCIRCIFVANRDCIFVSNDITKEALDNGHKPVFINFFTMPGWSGHASFYAIICPECKSFSVDYPHGYTGPGLIFLTCQTCNTNIVLLEREIYEREFMKPPPTFLEVFSRLIKLRLMKFKFRFGECKLLL